MKIKTNPYSRTFYVLHSVSPIFFYDCVTPPHSHNTLQLVFDLRKTFKCRVQHSGWRVYKSVIIKENAIHQLDTHDSVQLILYLDAESDAAKGLKLEYLGESDIFPLNVDIFDYAKPGELEQCLIEPNPELLEEVVYRLLNQLVDSQQREIGDERIKGVIKLLTLDGSEKMTIRHLARNVSLSESRLRFLFKKSIGVPLHRYIIWNKIMLAIGKIMNGSTIQDAAFDCGFTDSSHFHKLLLQMFGVSPSQFMKNNSKRNTQILSRHPLNMESRFFDNGYENPTRVYEMWP